MFTPIKTNHPKYQYVSPYPDEDEDFSPKVGKLALIRVRGKHNGNGFHSWPLEAPYQPYLITEVRKDFIEIKPQGEPLRPGDERLSWYVPLYTAYEWRRSPYILKVCYTKAE